MFKRGGGQGRAFGGTYHVLKQREWGVLMCSVYLRLSNWRKPEKRTRSEGQDVVAWSWRELWVKAVGESCG